MGSYPLQQSNSGSGPPLGGVGKPAREEGLAAGPRSDYERNGRVIHVDRDVQNTVKSPTEYASASELSGQRGAGGIYAMTDGVSDEAFEDGYPNELRSRTQPRGGRLTRARRQSHPEPHAPAASRSRRSSGSTRAGRRWGSRHRRRCGTTRGHRAGRWAAGCCQQGGAPAPWWSRSGRR